MARLYAQNRTSMWADDDFRVLSSDAQNLYNYLLAHPTTTYAGVAAWFPKRLAHVNQTWTAARVSDVGAELAAHHFIVIDEDWDEVCIRSFLRWESVLKAPNLARAMAHAFEKIESPRLQRVVIFELLRLKDEQPEWPAWGLPEFIDILTRRPPLDGRTIDAPISTLDDSSSNPSANPSQYPPEDPTSQGSGKGSGNPSRKGSPKASEVTSNQYPLPVTPEPVPANIEPRPAPNRATSSNDDEFSTRQELKTLDLDYSELRRMIARYTHREPTPGQVQQIAERFLGSATGTVKAPMAYVVTAIKQDWAVVQQMIDQDDVA